MAQMRATRFAEKSQGVSSVSAYSVRPASQISIFSEQIGNKTLTGAVRDFVEAGLLTVVRQGQLDAKEASATLVKCAQCLTGQDDCSDSAAG